MYHSKEICFAVNGELIEAGNSNNTVINAVSTDTRTVEEGALFVAIVGERFDAHDFAIKPLRQTRARC